MALIVKCRKCAKRIPPPDVVCPLCGRDDVRFVIDYWPRGRNGSRRQMTLPAEVKTRDDALDLERAFRAARSGPRPVENTSQAATVADLFPDYLGWYRQHRAETSWSDVNGAWRRDLDRVLGQYLASTINNQHYTLYQQLRGKTVSNRTVNKELNYFSGFLRWCRREKKLDIPRVDYDELPCSRPLPIVLSPDEAHRIIAAASQEPVYYALLLCLYTLGLRISTARELKAEDFDFANSSVRIRQKGGTWKLLPINDQVVEAVKAVIKLRKPKPGKALFSVRKSEEPIQNIRRQAQKSIGRAGNPE